MAKVIEHTKSIETEMKAAVSEWTKAQRAMWLEKSMARREHRKPNMSFAKAWIEAEAKIDALRIERKLYTNSYDSAAKPAPKEFQYDAAARVMLGPDYEAFAQQFDTSTFHRPP